MNLEPDHDPHNREIRELFSQPSGKTGELPTPRPRRPDAVRCDLREQMVNIENAAHQIRGLLHELEQLDRDA